MMGQECLKGNGLEDDTNLDEWQGWLTSKMEINSNAFKVCFIDK